MNNLQQEKYTPEVMDWFKAQMGDMSSAPVPEANLQVLSRQDGLGLGSEIQLVMRYQGDDIRDMHYHAKTFEVHAPIAGWGFSHKHGFLDAKPDVVAPELHRSMLPDLNQIALIVEGDQPVIIFNEEKFYPDNGRIVVVDRQSGASLDFMVLYPGDRHDVRPTGNLEGYAFLNLALKAGRNGEVPENDFYPEKG